MQPQKYERTTDFTERDGDDTDHSALNQELDEAALSINQVRENLALIQRDDGALANGIVTADALDPSAFDAVQASVNAATQEAQDAAASALLSATTANNAKDAIGSSKVAAETARDASLLNANNAAVSAAAASSSANSAAQTLTTVSGISAIVADKASVASGYASSASSSASSATTSKNNAATSEANAAASAAAAASSASTATTKATEAATSAVNAANSAIAAAASAAQVGSTVVGYANQVFTATAGQTTFSLTYGIGYENVYLNGVKLVRGDDYTATNGTSIVLASGAAAGDTIEVAVYGGFKGDTGATGSTGAAGTAATVNVGTVFTGTAGSSASVTNSGTANAAVLNFTIPRGDVGATGATGATGETGPANTVAIGTVTTGAAGSSAAATMTGTSPNQTLNLTIPRGDTGATGAAGNAATIAVGTVTTGAAGSSATITNSGTSNAAVFNFTIPRGADGTGSGTVSSVGMTVPTGLSVSGTPITGTGTFAVSLAAGYSIPTTASQTNWDAAYSWGNHASAGYLTASSTSTLTNKTFTGYTETVVTANTTTAYTINIANGTVQKLTLTGNCTYTFPTATAGQSFVLYQLQDATGSRTVTWPASVKWPSGTAPTLTSTASKADVFAFTADGTNWLGRVIGQSYL